MEDILVTIIGGLFCFFFLFIFATSLVQIFGIDRDKVQYKTGRLTMPTKKQVKYALIATIGISVIILLVAVIT